MSYKYQFRDYHGRYLYCYQSGEVYSLDGLMTFTINLFGDSWYITTPWNTNLSADANGRVYGTPNSGVSERWTITWLTSGHCTFKSSYGKYLCADPNGWVTADRDAVGPWELWYPIMIYGDTADAANIKSESNVAETTRPNVPPTMHHHHHHHRVVATNPLVQSAIITHQTQLAPAPVPAPLTIACSNPLQARQEKWKRIEACCERLKAAARSGRANEKTIDAALAGLESLTKIVEMMMK
eukprot:GEZU01019163.1.p1 GENE.GEZU01019163.1~~GEZU01019163.1.p1  ORF type:complete len:240 (+),score=50.17 GEZU01019163.1:74-793(+)